MPETAAPDSESFAGVLLNQPKATGRTYLINASMNGTHAIRENEWKFINGQGWISDGYYSQSGHAGGLVQTAMPESYNQGKGLRLIKKERIVPADTRWIYIALEIKGNNFKDITRSLPDKFNREGDYYLFEKSYDKANNGYGGYPYPDLLVPGVTEKFISLTMKGYESKTGNEFGKTIFFKLKVDLAKWLPKTNSEALVSDHELPIVLNRDNPDQIFWMITDKFTNKAINIAAKLGENRSDGVILNHSGQFSGYSLNLKDNYIFAIMEIQYPIQWNNLYPRRTIIKSKEKLPPGKLDINANISIEGQVVLKTNNKIIGEGYAKTLSVHPAGLMSLGKAPNNYTAVGNITPPFEYEGEIEQVIVNTK